MKRTFNRRSQKASLPKEVKAIFFDYDGVVADTMEDNYFAWRYAFGQHGVEIGREEYFFLEGMSPEAIAERLGTNHSLPQATFCRLAKTKAEYYRSHNKFRLYPRIHELLKYLKEKSLMLALISGAKRHRINEVTPRGFLTLFDLIVTADNVTKPKPDPEPYLLTLKSLGVKSGEVVVVENAPLGIQSAKAAGLYCIALCSTLDKYYLKESDVILNDLSDLIDFIKAKLK